MPSDQYFDEDPNVASAPTVRRRHAARRRVHDGDRPWSLLARSSRHGDIDAAACRPHTCVGRQPPRPRLWLGSNRHDHGPPFARRNRVGARRQRSRLANSAPVTPIATGSATSWSPIPTRSPTDVRFATIWSNPPIRIGKDPLHDLLLSWLGRLEPSGHAALVVQKHLGADSLQRWLVERGFVCVRAGSKAGFRILDVRPPADQHE